MPRFRKVWKLTRILMTALFGAAFAGLLAVAALYIYINPRLPDIDTLRQVRLQEPLRVYARDGTLLAEFGEKRRTPITYDNVPEKMIQAFLAAEDDRFFDHPGVDYQGLLRAAIHLIKTGNRGQGGSTITMQLARNFFLSREKTYLRKANEIFLALKIERELKKEDILELYLNKIYLGNRAYGVQAAAQVYYGVNVHELNLAQIAMIAGLPKAPSTFNPIANPSRAKIRRNYVLKRMLVQGFITEEERKQAVAEELTASLHGLKVDVTAAYVAEMVRAEVIAKYGEEGYSDGLRVYTTLDPKLQKAANDGLRKALLDYDVRHGWRGAEKNIDLAQHSDPKAWDEILQDIPGIGDLPPALVTEVGEKEAVVYLGKGEKITIPWEGLKWARAHKNHNAMGPVPKRAADILKVGDLVRVRKAAKEKDEGKKSKQGEAAAGDEYWMLAQIPEVSGAFVSVLPEDGAIVALIGGFDFNHSKFNRATQARRQPGSSFKPFIYSAALNKGYTPASTINDAPIVMEDAATEELWRPKNSNKLRFSGPMRMREALVQSRNLVAIRMLRDIGIDYAAEYASRFGIDQEELPKNLSMVLGTASVTPLQIATGYAVLANGGFQVQPYFIDRIESDSGEVLFKANPLRACKKCQNSDEVVDIQDLKPVKLASIMDPQGDDPEQPRYAPRVITAQNSYLMYSMMRDVIRRGTAKRALALGRSDLAGKTGTTNEQRDAWFSGFNRELVGTAWVGFDKVQPLGSTETGGRAALPMWMEYMRVALKDTPNSPLPHPPKIVTLRIDPKTGLLARGSSKAIVEVFRADNVPKRAAGSDADAQRKAIETVF